MRPATLDSMRVSVKRSVVWQIAVAALLGGLLSACEDNSESIPLNLPSEVAPLTVEPISTTLSSTNNVTILTARGGTAPYSWKVSDISLGAVPDIKAYVVTYTRVASAQGANLVTVTDKNQWQAQALITQE